MAEHEPFASPYHQVRLPGQEQEQPPGWVSPVVGPMPSSSWETAERTRPATLTASFWCWLAATVLVVLGLPGVFALQHEEFAQVLMEDNSASGTPLDEATARFAALATSGVFAVGFAILAVPYVVGFINLRAGKGWARVLLAVLGGLGLLFGLIALAAFTGGVEDMSPRYGYLWVAVFLITTTVAVVLMFLPSANDHVRGTRR
ncbi:hypothetical protein [Umezawaea sp.]|uniref:hypothetical protein n=1 Tax=Umezawaea sp. TaxID=1955258 RepID=UPI002ED1E5DE